MGFRLSLSAFVVTILFALSTGVVPVSTPTPRSTDTPVRPPTATPIPRERQEALVLHVVDGDTIVVDLDGKRYSVRYIGIDTPETHHPTDGADYWGFEATEANKSMVKEGKKVVLQRDLSETDIYGRLLRYIWVDDVLVNAELVRMGLACVLFYEPDVLYKHEVMEAETEAKAAKRGLYGPKPTPPAEVPLLYKGNAWTQSLSGEAVHLRYDPARGEPVMAFPAGVQVRVVDAFWVPEAQEWWYWIGINGFNGWVTGEYVTRERPENIVSGPPEPFEAYDRLSVVEKATVYLLPQEDEIVGELPAGTSVQVKRASWVEATDVWWYYVESTVTEGWVEPDHLGK